MTASGNERLLFEGVEWRGVERWSFRCNLFDGTPNERREGVGGVARGERERERRRGVTFVLLSRHKKQDVCS